MTAPVLHLVGHDGTERGDDAVALARALGGDGVRRTVVHVAEPGAGAAARAARDERLDALRAGLGAHEELVVVEDGSPARILHDRAEADGAQLVVVGPHHRQGVSLAVLGTVADRLVHGGPCPVAMAAPGVANGPGTIRRIVAAYDGGPDADVAIAVAASLAATARAVVDVVTVHDPPVPVGAAGFAAMPVESAEESARRAHAVACRALDRLDDAVVGVTRTPAPPIGPAIVEASAAADLVVCGSRGYGPLRRVLLGSTGRHLLHHATCSVLVVPRTAETDRQRGARAAA